VVGNTTEPETDMMIDGSGVEIHVHNKSTITTVAASQRYVIGSGGSLNIYGYGGSTFRGASTSASGLITVSSYAQLRIKDMILESYSSASDRPLVGIAGGEVEIEGGKLIIPDYAKTGISTIEDDSAVRIKDMIIEGLGSSSTNPISVGGGNNAKSVLEGLIMTGGGGGILVGGPGVTMSDILIDNTGDVTMEVGGKVSNLHAYRQGQSVDLVVKEPYSAFTNCNLGGGQIRKVPANPPVGGTTFVNIFASGGIYLPDQPEILISNSILGSGDVMTGVGPHSQIVNVRAGTIVASGEDCLISNSYADRDIDFNGWDGIKISNCNARRYVGTGSNGELIGSRARFYQTFRTSSWLIDGCRFVAGIRMFGDSYGNFINGCMIQSGILDLGTSNASGINFVY